MPNTPESDGRLSLPGKTTPTWEMELLVSGATIFGLLQVPALLDRSFEYLFNNSSDAFPEILLAMWVYGKTSLFILIATFVAHLCLRGYWVALVGMDSVYAGGIRWDRLRIGPIAREMDEKLSIPIAQAIENADNRATRMFGAGFGMAMVMLVPIVIVLAALPVAVVANALSGPELAKLLFWTMVILVVGPFFLSSMLDQQIGKRLDPQGRPARAMERLMRGYRRLGMDSSTNLLMGLFVSHEGPRRATWLGFLFMLPIFVVIIASSYAARGGLDFGSSPAWPSVEPFASRSAPAAFYDSPRAERSGMRPLPYLANRVASGPYLPLFVPFIPRQHEPAMRRACPKAVAASRELDSGLVLDCLARLIDLRIDGAKVTVPLVSSTDPQTGQRGLLAMLPTEAIASGQHEVSLNAPRRKRDEESTRRYRIPFWK